jgi:hypothetical protein
MRPGRLVYRLAQVYAILLVTVGVTTALWLVGPELVASPALAGTWLAVGGFGLLLLVALFMVLASRG